MTVGKKSRKEPLNTLAVHDALDGASRFVAAFSGTSAIELAVYNDQLRFKYVNSAAAAIPGIPAEAFVGNTIRDIIGDAGAEPEARLRQLLVGDETPALEISAMLPMRSEPGYWIQKSFPIKGRSGSVIQIASLAVEVTANRKLEACFRKLAGERVWGNEEHQRLARDLRESINEYHAALGTSLDRLRQCTEDPDSISNVFAHSMDSLDEHRRKVAYAVSRCFPNDQH
jgi:hypothetical protein